MLRVASYCIYKRLKKRYRQECLPLPNRKSTDKLCYLAFGHRLGCILIFEPTTEQDCYRVRRGPSQLQIQLGNCMPHVYRTMPNRSGELVVSHTPTTCHSAASCFDAGAIVWSLPLNVFPILSSVNLNTWGNQSSSSPSRPSIISTSPSAHFQHNTIPCPWKLALIHSPGSPGISPTKGYPSGL